MTALVDPSRRALYDYVRRAGHPVSREEAAVAADPTDADHAAGRHAREHGQVVGGVLAEGGADLTAALEHLGFEPESTGRRMLLHNCPFHALAARHTTLVCGLNQAFLAGLL